LLHQQPHCRSCDQLPVGPVSSTAALSKQRKLAVCATLADPRQNIRPRKLQEPALLLLPTIDSRSPIIIMLSAQSDYSRFTLTKQEKKTPNRAVTP
jgi:hypothetical protein